MSVRSSVQVRSRALPFFSSSEGCRHCVAGYSASPPRLRCVIGGLQSPISGGPWFWDGGTRLARTATEAVLSLLLHVRGWFLARVGALLVLSPPRQSKNLAKCSVYLSAFCLVEEVK